MKLLIEDSGIRDAWWDTLEISSLWAFENAMERHFEYENRELLPAATALSAASALL